MQKITLLLFILFVIHSQLKAGGDDHNAHPHHLSIFTGYSSDFKNHHGYKLGIEYEYKINSWMGVGGMMDFTGADFEIFAISAGVDFSPIRKVPFFVGTALGAKNEKKDKWKPFVRGVAGYDFHIGKFSLGPVVMHDFYNARKNILSVGIGFGISF